MERVTATMEPELLAALDAHVQARGYANRSEALRDLVRDGLSRARTEDAAGGASCIATLSYVYDHSARALAQRLAQAQHDRHDLTIASLHVHLDHHACLEVAVLRGPTAEVQRLAEQLTVERGVQHGALHLVPSRLDVSHHRHGEGEDVAHLHVSPLP
jgi:CopG family nickel-responsive transcriptional regulator